MSTVQILSHQIYVCEVSICDYREKNIGPKTTNTFRLDTELRSDWEAQA